jgi:hypothetical protein
MTPLLDAVPFARTLGIEFTSVTETSAVAVLPDDSRLHNHVGGPHAGRPVQPRRNRLGRHRSRRFRARAGSRRAARGRASIAYSKLARGTVTATATLASPADAVVAELETGHRPEFDVLIGITNAEGQETARMTVTWTLRPM